MMLSVSPCGEEIKEGGLVVLLCWRHDLVPGPGSPRNARKNGIPPGPRPAPPRPLTSLCRFAVPIQRAPAGIR